VKGDEQVRAVVAREQAVAEFFKAVTALLNECLPLLKAASTRGGR